MDWPAYIDPSRVPVRVSLKPFTLVNLNAQYKLSDRFSVFGRVENLFDVKYEEVFSFATPGAGLCRRARRLLKPRRGSGREAAHRRRTQC